MQRNPWLVASVTTVVLIIVENDHWLLTRLYAYNALHRNYPLVLGREHRQDWRGSAVRDRDLAATP